MNVMTAGVLRGIVEAALSDLLAFFEIFVPSCGGDDGRLPCEDEIHAAVGGSGVAAGCPAAFKVTNLCVK